MSIVFMLISVPMGNLILDHCGVQFLVLSFQFPSSSLQSSSIMGLLRNVQVHRMSRHLWLHG